MHIKNLVEAGKPIQDASRAIVMLHGRGASADDILSLKMHLPLHDYHIVAPQAMHYTWYPYSFMAPIEQNEPWLSSALELLSNTVHQINEGGIPNNKIVILGFSQGACLTLEFSTRMAQRWGGVIAFTGGLIGDKIYTEHYSGNFQKTPVFISNSNNDPHVPLKRSEDTKSLMKKLGAEVTLEVYPNRPHTILKEELLSASKVLNSL